MVKDPAFLADAAKLNADIVVAQRRRDRGLLVKTYGSPRALIERAIADFKKAATGH